MKKPGLADKIKNRYLGKFRNDSFVVQQKAYVLFWIQIILIPILIAYLIINTVRCNSFSEALVVLVDIVFILNMAIALVFLVKGKYNTAVNLNIVIVTLLTVLGLIARWPGLKTTGYNSFTALIFPLLVFIGMFGRRRIYFAVFLIFTLIVIYLHLVVKNYLPEEYLFILLNNFLNIIIGLVIVFCFTYFNNLITQRSMEITEQELKKNKSLNKELEKNIEKKVLELKLTTEEVKELKGLIPICSKCKKIRDDQGYWEHIETYISTHSNAEFSHGICPDCMKKLYPGFEVHKY